MKKQKAVHFFCKNPVKDEVAPLVLAKSMEILPLTETDMVVDGEAVLSYEDPLGNIHYYVTTETVICMDWERYLPIMNQYFADCDLAVMVNWHGGANAPDKVLCIHTVGDVTSGIMGPSNPVPTSNLARAMEKHRLALNLEDFKVTTEATHWSGIVYGSQPELIPLYPVAFLDLEIGSTSESYQNPQAIEVLARALPETFLSQKRYPTLLYLGGIHFEDTITAGVLHPDLPVSLTHILPSRWIENEHYLGEEGIKRLKHTIDTIQGGIDGFVIHEKLKRENRELIMQLAEELQLPLIKRKALKSPENLTQFHW